MQRPMDDEAVVGNRPKRHHSNDPAACLVADVVQALQMHDDRWVWPERRDLYVACLTLADPQAASARLGQAAGTLLNDIELYDDPRQGADLWLFPDEASIADDLATKLRAIIEAETPEDWGEALSSIRFGAASVPMAKAAWNDPSGWTENCAEGPLTASGSPKADLLLTTVPAVQKGHSEASRLQHNVSGTEFQLRSSATPPIRAL